MTAQLASASSDLAALDADIANLESQLSGIETQIQTTQDEIDQVTVEISTIKSQLDAESAASGQTSPEVLLLQSQLTIKQSALRDHQDWLDSLWAQYDPAKLVLVNKKETRSETYAAKILLQEQQSLLVFYMSVHTDYLSIWEASYDEAYARNDLLKMRIQDCENLLNSVQANVQDAEIGNLRALVSTLSGYQPTADNLVWGYYYRSCYGTNVTLYDQLIGGQRVEIIRYSSVPTYLRNQYRINMTYSGIDLIVSVLSIISSEWTSRFGDVLASASFTEQPLAFVSSFSCLLSMPLVTVFGTGTISTVAGTYIQIFDGKTSIKLLLSPCSRMEKAYNLLLPKSGQLIYYQAVSQTPSVLQLISATCI